ncbi:MAG: hypothetical protein FJ130_01880 [Deltaproteobacteria bacterium]|nr:hypothetical protein [Deltaproteobacteria bacterium]
MNKQDANVSPQNVPPSNVPSALDLLKTIGVVVGGLGSVAGGSAALFYWIGNTIIVSRLREYNLYGIVRYTDEYIKEAGYQFIQDIFACFTNLYLIFLSVGILTLTIYLIPIGPLSYKDKIWEVAIEPSMPPWIRRGWLKKMTNVLLSMFKVLWIPLKFILMIRRSNLHYLVFALLVGTTSVLLLSNYAERRLSRNIVKQAHILSATEESMKKRPLTLTLKAKKEHGIPNEFQQIFYAELTKRELFLMKEMPRDWLCQSLSELDFPCSLKDNSLRNAVEKYQNNKGIHESPDFKFDGDFEKSKTAEGLLRDILIKKINVKLYLTVQKTLAYLQAALKGHLTGESEDDFAIFIINPSSYNKLNDLVQKLINVRKNINFFFEPDGEAKKILTDLGKIKKIFVGRYILSCSFWVFIGLLIYLIINIPKILQFKHWEQGYFLLMLLISLTIAINLPATYGRYIFEFKIQKINNIIFSDEKETAGKKSLLQKEIDKLLDGNMLYILGPTKEKEVIVGAITKQRKPDYGIAQIIMLNRETYKYINVEPAEEDMIPEIVRILKRQRRSF